MGLSWMEEEAARAEVRGGDGKEWYTVLVVEHLGFVEGKHVLAYSKPRGFCYFVKTPKEAQEAHWNTRESNISMTVAIVAGRLIDEIGQMEFKEVRGADQR